MEEKTIQVFRLGLQHSMELIILVTPKRVLIRILQHHPLIRMVVLFLVLEQILWMHPRLLPWQLQLVVHLLV